MERGAVYIRVSTEDQAEFSPDAQLHAIRQYAERNNITISNEHIFNDVGISGRRADKRPGFMRMIGTAKIKPKPFDVILVHKFDRFARNREDSIVYKSLLRKDCKIRVVSVTEQMEDDKFSVILESMLEAMAEYYSLNLGEEVKKGMTEKARRGELQTPAPFGYRMADGLLRIQEDEAHIVKYIFTRYADENIGAKKIAREINERGFKTIKGNAFDKRAIEYIIRNPVYAGKIRWTQDAGKANRHEYDNPQVMVVNGRHDAIIDIRLWEQASNKLLQSKSNSRPSVSREYESCVTTHWLRGLARCAECGSALSYGKGFEGRESAYRCNRYLNGGCDFSQRIVVSRLEEAIIEAIDNDTRHVFTEPYVKIVGCDSDSVSKISEIQNRIRKNEMKSEKARTLVLEGIDTAEEYKKTKDVLLEENRTLTKTLSELYEAGQNKKKEPIKIIGLRDMLLSSQFSLTEKNLILKEIISNIIYNKQEDLLEINYRQE